MGGGTCNWCGKKADRLYELRKWDVCFDCYFEDADEQTLKAEQANNSVKA
ncbi:hypothetical protein LCGC14_2913230 [marine sediment metagenome]|uniref:Uncharacterized protein n=1 Tax=marine sediment metagenome TaxID=412755 RepID=A0A0F9AH72_9ZZZZ